MRVIIAGSRTVMLEDAMFSMLDRFIKGIATTVICGGAEGADKIGKKWAKARNIQVLTMNANWERDGKAAGPIRNEKMCKVADMLVAVWDMESKGTRDMIGRAAKKQIPVLIIPESSLAKASIL